MRKIPLTRGKYAVVDEVDYAILNMHKWYCFPGKKTFYATRVRGGGDNTLARMHRVILDAKEGQIVDHINGNGLDNRRSNLRFVTSRENALNRSKSRGAIYKGVSKVRDKYRARIRLPNNILHLGYFLCPKLAAKAYDRAALRHFGQYAKTNF